MIVVAKQNHMNRLRDWRRGSQDGWRQSHAEIQKQLLTRAFKELDAMNVPASDQYDWLEAFYPRAIPPEIQGGSPATYAVYNSAQATTAAPVAQPTGTSIRTMVQIRTATNVNARLIAWGCSFSGSAAATPGNVELFENTAAATMSTAYAAGDFMPFGQYNAVANTAGSSGIPFNLSTTTSGFATTSVTEGTVAAYRMADLAMLPPTGPYVYQWPLGMEFELTPQLYLRCRVTFAATINMYIWILIQV